MAGGQAINHSFIWGCVINAKLDSISLGKVRAFSRGGDFKPISHKDRCETYADVIAVFNRGKKVNFFAFIVHCSTG